MSLIGKGMLYNLLAIYHSIAYLKSERHEFENKLKSKYWSEEEIEDIQGLCVWFRLPMELHGQADCVEHDENEDGVLEWLWRHEPPDLILEPILWYVSPHRLSS